MNYGEKCSSTSSNAAWRQLKLRYPFPEYKPRLAGGVSGWNTDENRALFDSIARSHGALVIELGVWLGQTTLELLSLDPTLRIVCIDHWRGSPEHAEHAYYKKLLPTLYNRFVVNVWDHQDRVVPMKETTLVGMEQLAAVGIDPDFIYIDASHEYEDAKRDIETALRLFPNARITGDDYDWPGIQKAIADLGLAASTKNNGRCWWLSRPAPEPSPSHYIRDSAEANG